MDACEVGLIEDNSDNIPHLILDGAGLEFAGFAMTDANNLSLWNSDQNDNQSVRPQRNP